MRENEPGFQNNQNFFDDKFECPCFNDCPVLDYKQCTINVVTVMRNPGNEEQLLDIGDKKSKAYSEKQLTFDREFWSIIALFTSKLEVLVQF